MDWRAMFKGQFIAAAEFEGRTPTLTIREVKLVAVADEKSGRDKDKGTVFFEETDRGWILCRTVAACLAGMFGSDTTQWHGKRVTLHATEVQFGRERVLGIRVLGSPDLDRPVAVEVKLPRKKPVTMTMRPTGKGRSAPSPSGPTGPDGEREAGEADRG